MKETHRGARTEALPVLAPADPPCERCRALCCRYYALEIDPPEDEDDFEDLRWYLLHRRSWIWVDDGEWYLQVDEECRYLGDDGRCGIYQQRPRICREYGVDPTDEPRCDYFVDVEKHDLEFREPEEMAAYARRFLARREAERRRRSAAAKKGWQRRRAARQKRDRRSS